MSFFFNPVDSPSVRLDWLAGLSKKLLAAGSKNEVLDLIDDALSVPRPGGDPGELESLAMLYRGQIDAVSGVHDQVDRVGRKSLSEVWVGDTSVLASDVVSAAARSVDQMREAFQGCASVLLTLSDAIGAAQRKDEQGRGQLLEQKKMLGGRDGFFDDLHENDEEEWDRKNAAHFGSYAVDLMHGAVSDAQEATRVAARDLNKWASEARAGKMQTSELTPADKLMLADTGVAGADAELNEILTASDLERASTRMDLLSLDDEMAMERMLATSDSPQERAYLMKALAAGHSVDEIQTFQNKIHGKDPAWMSRHLTPVVTASDSMDDEGLAPDGSNNNKDEVSFDGQRWIQGGDGSEGTCVASSTVTSRAMVDPVYALELTGGPDGQQDDPEAFKQRLVAEQHRLHTEGDGGKNWGGMGPEGQERINDNEVGRATGSDYQRQDLNSAADRRAVLTDVENSVAQGHPVPVDVSGDKGAHAMTIIAQEGDMLQVYNPWGETTWVSEDDFINGHMGKASDSDLPNAYSVYLPQQ
ncbi:peptidoglycan-binding protein [Streptomyces sp. VRA16 Mangrove soil]|uniref:peptidoglycan-binding protein n=1 Tax=Streptomyces sp. VRA16 Mangrove soil TaxID=2817434 RepID=UPI001A9E8D7B|nr:peptidoglycan-binding protein [Streptomyces sp. VRA16 Mangrove soil]MBO1332126.1 peptidoglycan-binding protein [Streptomyces sp. VRA16 Mangrove soil]